MFQFEWANNISARQARSPNKRLPYRSTTGKIPIHSLQPPVWFAPNLAAAGQTDTALPRALVGGQSQGFKRTKGQEDEDPILGVACVGGSGGSTGMASSLHKWTVATCKSSMRNKQYITSLIISNSTVQFLANS